MSSQPYDNYGGFSNQLASIGLKIRDIPGDGNCLFRALADQLEGHSKNHRRHRAEAVKYMIDHRSDFEPFVEDDCTFDDHVYKLRQDGTYAGNDAIVAFARKNGVNVVIHQLNAPMWTIAGSDRSNIPQLHIAYHNGDHYSSVRKLNDNSENPAGLKLMSKSEKKQQLSSKRDPRRKQPSPSASARKQMQHIFNVTGCQGLLRDALDLNGLSICLKALAKTTPHQEEILPVFADCLHKDSRLIYQLLDENDYSEDIVIGILLQIQPSPNASDEDTHKAQSSKTRHNSHTNLWEPAGTGSRLFGSQNIPLKQQEAKNKTSTPPKKLSNKKRKEEVKRERKKKSDEKKRNGGSTSQSNLSDSDDSEIVLKNIDILKI